MIATFSRVLALGTSLVAAMMQLSSPAAAAPPIWANAKWVKATATVCGGVRHLILMGNSVNERTRSDLPSCTSSEEIFHLLNVSRKFLRGGNRGEISASQVDAGYIYCGPGEAAINLGASGEAERAIREHPAPPGCSYATRRHQYVSSVGSIPFTNLTNGGTMSIAESLAMHTKERDRAIEECNASPSCWLK